VAHASTWNVGRRPRALRGWAGTCDCDRQRRFRETDRPPIEHPPLAGYTLRDAIEHMAAHNSHHLGQVVLLRQMLGAWPPPSGSYTW
jgi:uncharacterized damage-inducible protein DinB